MPNISEETSATMESLADGIEYILKKTTGRQFGFALLVFDIEQPGLSNYVSNSSRAGMIMALRDCADRLERGEDMPATVGNA